ANLPIGRLLELAVKRDRIDSAFGALIDWFIRAGQPERRTLSRFDYFKHYFKILHTYFLFSYGNKYFRRYINLKYRVTSLLGTFHM
ncbi:hypothetical protein SFRURICE_019502, partial [Spodoptera frugiperda]